MAKSLFDQMISSRSCPVKLKGYDLELRAYEASDTTCFWLLGPEGPEMNAVEALLRESGETNIIYAVALDGTRVKRETAYQATNIIDRRCRLYVVGCNLAIDPVNWYDLNCDRSGDRGYMLGSSAFMYASCIGQVLSELVKFHVWKTDPESLKSIRLALDVGEIVYIPSKRRWFICVEQVCGCNIIAQIPLDYVCLAAASLCLSDVYDDMCPGVTRAEMVIYQLADGIHSQKLRILAF